MKSIIVFLGLACVSAARQKSQLVNFYSIEKEIAMGQQLAGRLVYQLPLVNGTALENYVTKLGTSLAAQADKRFQYSFTLFDDRKLWAAPENPLAMPSERTTTEPIAIAGGPLFVPLMLLAKASDESTFAFQLAHAVAHVALRHGTRMATRTQLIQIGAVPIANMPGAPPQQELAILNFARNFELQADSVAAGIMAAAGYDPRLAIPYLEALPDSVPKVFSDHPSGERRSGAVKAAIEKLPAREYSANTGEFAAMKARAAQ